MTPDVKIQDVVNEWKTDCLIDETVINTEICRTPSLHSKYLNYYIHFKNELSKTEKTCNRLLYIKRRYYRGECTQEELKKYEWEQYQGLKMSSSEFNSFIDSDPDISGVIQKIDDLKTSVTTIEYIMKSISGRDWALKSLVEYQKYINGG